MAFREIITGGACNADDQSSQRNQNPVKNFVNYMVSGKSNINQKLEGFHPSNQAQIANMPLEMQFNHLNHEFERAKLLVNEDERLMNEQWGMAQKRHEHEQHMMERMMQDQWRNEQQIHRQQMIEFAKNKEAMWGDAKQKAREEEIKMESANWFQDYAKLENQDLKGLEDAFEDAENQYKAQNNEQEVIQQATDDMMDVMANDPDPKFQNSQFLQFLRKIKTGEHKIENNKLITNPEVQNNALENAFLTAQQNYDSYKGLNPEERDLQAAWEGVQPEEYKMGDQNEEIDAMFDNAWSQAEKTLDKEELRNQMEQEYKQLLESMDIKDPDAINDVIADAWQIAQDIEEGDLYGEPDQEYRFSQANPYAGLANPLEKASEFVAVGNRREAIMAMESHLQKNPQDGKSWRLLGKLHQENDQDRQALPCLLNAAKADPQDQETLLLLGVSCTNILDEVQAMWHLKNWLQSNPKYAGIKLDPNMIPEGVVGQDIEVEKIRGMYKSMIDTFEQARQIDPQDPNLLMSLAVLYFIARDYKQSVFLFNEALKFDPNNYTLWNKLGATLAHLGRTEEAIDAYHRALEIKPNFVRVWANLGMAHAFKRDFEEAIRLYLNALNLNPEAKHIWNYLQTACICLERFDLIPKIKSQDVNAFRDEFDIIDSGDLPQPEIDYRLQVNELVFKKEADNWASDFNNAQINPGSEFDT